MDVIITKKKVQKIKGFLVFFYAVLLPFGCQNTETMTPTVEYENDKAVRVLFKGKGDSDEFSVYLNDNRNSPILGSFSEKNGFICFTPVLPFSKTHEFGIAQNGKQIANFKVNTTQTTRVPELLVIHPKHDTVPVNILKIYLEFSEPMQHVGSPLDFITIFDTTDSIEVYPFLDVAVELWNKSHTRLTLWFDPGRIKTDLIPNKEKGLPLKESHSYSITIDKNWKSEKGVPLGQSYSKSIHVIGKDMERPNPSNWVITSPEKNTNSPLQISFNEILDPVLALESIQLFHGDSALSGNLELSHDGKTMLWEPYDVWKAGDYRIVIHPILEDLAGNNLHSLFDTDLRKPNSNNEMVSSLEFTIQ